MHTNLIILAGGISSRMKKETAYSGLSDEEISQANKRSKGLISIGNSGRPLIDYLLFNAKRAGYKKIYIVINEEGDLFKTFYGKKDHDNEFNGLEISFVVQYIPEGRIKPFGTADALFQAVEQYPELNKDYYSVCNSDNLYSFEALQALRYNKSENALISYDRDALQFTSNRISQFALMKLSEENNLIGIIEKPKLSEVKDYKDNSGKLRVSMNLFKFNGAMLYEYLKNCPIQPDRNEKELPTALLNMLKNHPNSVKCIPFSEHVIDLTSKQDIETVKTYLKAHFNELNWQTEIN